MKELVLTSEAVFKCLIECSQEPGENLGGNAALL